MTPNFSLEPIAECSLIIRFESQPHIQMPQHISRVANILQVELEEYIMNITPSFSTILIDYLPHRVTIFEFFQRIENIVLECHIENNIQAAVINLPVFYHDSVGLDLKRYYDRGLTLDHVIEQHTKPTYQTAAIGFAPGFAFQEGVLETLSLPRLVTPRLEVAKGSVAIAGTQTAIYPDRSPGGWNIIGNCPIDLYCPNSMPMTPFGVGGQVKFFSIGEARYQELKGCSFREFIGD